MALCAVTDVRYHRIPNKVMGTGAAAGLMYVFWTAWAAEGVLWDKAVAAAVLGYLMRMALTMAAVFPFFLFRMVGAGDIKLMSLVTAYLGMGRGLESIGVGLCLGAVLALGRMLREGSACQRFLYLAAYIRRLIQSKEIEVYYCPERDGYDCVIPLGACLFAGTLAAALWRG